MSFLFAVFVALLITIAALGTVAIVGMCIENVGTWARRRVQARRSAYLALLKSGTMLSNSGTRLSGTGRSGMRLVKH